MVVIPEKLRRALEDNEVVFFCGAGTSMGAGLPSFKGLVESVLKDLLPREGSCEPGSPDALTWDAFNRGRYDETLGFLETPREGGYEPKKVRERVRHHLAGEAKTLSSHLTLIRLADLDTEEGRLVTTNFDTLFEDANEELQRKEQTDRGVTISIAPALPPAKPEKLEGLVYLHGRLGSSPNDRQLVLTTADFGMAYMLEGWALRFVVELFRHFHVVFLGYRLEDPTMRYLVRALTAAREESAEQFKEPFAFTSFSREDDVVARGQAERKWTLTGITPIPFNKANKYQELWSALEAWADDHRQGIAGRRQTVARLGQHPPASGDEDAATLEMAWALKDPEVARYFANPKGFRCAKCGWIGPLQKQGLFSLPTSWTEDGQDVGASLVSWQLNDHVGLHPATRHLGHWISRCLNSQDAIDWVLREGAVLHRELRDLIDSQLNSRESRAISPAVHKLWRVLAELGYAHMLAEKNQSDRFGNFGRPRVASRAPFTTRIFLDRLRPVPVFTVKPDYSRREGKRDPKRPSDWYEVNMELVGIRGGYEIKEFRNRAKDWEKALAVMADDLTTRLAEAMDWFSEFGLASPDADTTHIEYRSISPHDQNKNARTWTQLIALVRDAHDALRSCGDKAGASRLERRWQSMSYPVFRRLVLHSATEPSDADLELGLEVLLEGENPALWDLMSLREALRFLRKRGADL